MKNYMSLFLKVEPKFKSQLGNFIQSLQIYIFNIGFLLYEIRN